MDGIYFREKQIKVKNYRFFMKYIVLAKRQFSKKFSAITFLPRFGHAQLFSPGMKNCFNSAVSVTNCPCRTNNYLF